MVIVAMHQLTAQTLAVIQYGMLYFYNQMKLCALQKYNALYGFECRHELVDTS